ncbi:DNA (cytosine-5-)-methyltransferase [Gloeomargarita lithophora Alchichica-D10]|uniref:DNA (Cytosine-5-)-methyltransferase n=1 Tax=Gloeomargarita lithophora Alchichica-D10 TaxID=1188229 RepID=A0A1J0AEF6_9CYAN|nr:site-specific DNA-methyltransferase [Gloeomargarita lithophora]APB34296.1 DNA (cytosine-5-)-methyltransferase [Gloeomargarita lithophora Alchichica-D10]
MATNQPEKLTGTSLDISAENRANLKVLFPTVFTETRNDNGEIVDSIDFEKLKAELGTFSDVFESRRERYGMDWPGKKEALRLIQTPSYATLKPCRDESVNFDNTENLFIEGDNLEVLKLLQKSYYGKVKMIYIDPPYNTGKEFIYPDNYTESLDTYLEYAGLIDGEGKKFNTNTANEGRFHTKWLNMMYPRLYLARNLLRDDGVIFISINDQEQKNLKEICNDIFGEDNYLTTLIWDKNHSAQAGIFKVYHEYVYVYSKIKLNISTPQSEDSDEFEAGAMKKESSRHPLSRFVFPKGTRFDAPDGFELSSNWGDTEKVILHSGRFIAQAGKLLEDVEIEAAFTQANQMKQYFYGNKDTLIDSRGQRILEFYFNSTGKLKISKERSVFTPPTIGRWGTQGDCSEELATLFGLTAAPLETPKSPKMLKDFLIWFTKEDDIVCDFFAGSSTTAHSILELNMIDNSARKFILVQLPEPCAEDSEAFKAGYKTIADIGKERIHRVIKKIKEEQAGNLDLSESSKQDLGFKVLKLDKSNFRQWQQLDPSTPPEKVEEELFKHIGHISDKATPEDLLYEILLKAGFTPTEKIDTKTIAGKNVFSIAGGALLLCLEAEITKELINAVAELEPMQFICLDSAFHGNDQLKANAVQTFAARNMQKEKHNQIIFKTV